MVSSSILLLMYCSGYAKYYIRSIIGLCVVLDCKRGWHHKIHSTVWGGICREPHHCRHEVTSHATLIHWFGLMENRN